VVHASSFCWLRERERERERERVRQSDDKTQPQRLWRSAPAAALVHSILVSLVLIRCGASAGAIGNVGCVQLCRESVRVFEAVGKFMMQTRKQSDVPRCCVFLQQGFVDC
jgi:hypothetical protein